MAIEESQRKLYTTLMFIYFALLGSILTYLLVAYFFFMQNPAKLPLPPANYLTLRYAFFGASLVSAGLSFFLKQRLLGNPRQGSVTPAQKFNSAHVIAWALCESVSIYGLVLFFLGRSLNDFIPFFVASMGLMLIHYPKKAAWEAYVAGLPQA